MDKRTENALTIAAALGVAAEEALALLAKSVDVLRLANDPLSLIPDRTAALLSRTFDDVRLVDEPSGSADLTICWEAPSPGCRNAMSVSCNEGVLAMRDGSPGRFDPNGLGVGQQTIAACYVAAMATRQLLPGIAGNGSPPIIVLLDQFALGPTVERVDIGETVLVGAGAIGNAFVWSLEPDALTGTLTILDKDDVGDGNLQRNILCEGADVGTPKVAVLHRYLAARQPQLKVIPVAERTEAVFGARGETLRIERLISAVDSPRARRALQYWFPREVFDASTSGIQEVIFHHNRHPLESACLECVYPFTRDEQQHERHVAEALGVPVEALAERIISENRARMIVERYPELEMRAVVGEAYDSLFKQLCGAQRLLTSEGHRVLAPFAFVSVLAGAVLAIEFQRRVRDSDTSPYNFWRLNPWLPPRPSLRRVSPTNPVCTFCAARDTGDTMRALWGE